MLVFSIVLPVVKLFYLLLLATLPISELKRWSRQLHALEWLGKWSMHDVLVLSLTIFFIKSQGVYDARSLNGVYFFTAAVLFMILAYAWLRADVEGEGNVDPAKQILDAPPPQSAPLRNFVLSVPDHPRDGVLRARHHPAGDQASPPSMSGRTSTRSPASCWALYQNEEYVPCAS